LRKGDIVARPEKEEAVFPSREERKVVSAHNVMEGGNLSFRKGDGLIATGKEGRKRPRATGPNLAVGGGEKLLSPSQERVKTFILV